MAEISRTIDIKEAPGQKPDVSDCKSIKPEGEISTKECQGFWDKLFNLEIPDGEEKSYDDKKETDNSEIGLEEIKNEYIDDLRSKSEYPETIQENPFEASDLKKLSPEEVAEKREEFDDRKIELKKLWELENGCIWPKYENDIYSSNGKLIRKAGSDYDAHHIKPLGMGGENDVKNITPLHAEVHYDKQGVHSPDSPYSKLDKMLGGNDR